MFLHNFKYQPFFLYFWSGTVYATLQKFLLLFLSILQSKLDCNSKWRVYWHVYLHPFLLHLSRNVNFSSFLTRGKYEYRVQYKCAQVSNINTRETQTCSNFGNNLMKCLLIYFYLQVKRVLSFVDPPMYKQNKQREPEVCTVQTSTDHSNDLLWKNCKIIWRKPPKYLK